MAATARGGLFTAAEQVEKQVLRGGAAEAADCAMRSCGLIPDPRVFLPAPLLTLDIKWKQRPPGGYFSGVVYTDGSGMHPTDRMRKRCGCGVAQMVGVVVAGGCYAALPRLWQEVTAGEILAGTIALRHCLPPLEIRSDSLTFVEGFHEGKDYCLQVGRAYREEWVEFWRVADDIGHHNIRVGKVLGHATQEMVDRGVVKEEDKIGNDASDRLAKKGARLHPGDAITDDRIDKVDDLVKEVARHIAKVQGAFWDANAADVQDVGHKAKRAPKADGGIDLHANGNDLRKIGKTWTCDKCGRRHNARAVVASLQCPGRKPWILALFDDTHRLAIADPLVFCKRCGCYASERGRKLKSPCKGPPRGGTAAKRLDLLGGGWHPMSNARLGPQEDWPLVVPSARPDADEAAANEGGDDGGGSEPMLLEAEGRQQQVLQQEWGVAEPRAGSSTDAVPVMFSDAGAVADEVPAGWQDGNAESFERSLDQAIAVEVGSSSEGSDFEGADDEAERLAGQERERIIANQPMRPGDNWNIVDGCARVVGLKSALRSATAARTTKVIKIAEANVATVAIQSFRNEDLWWKAGDLKTPKRAVAVDGAAGGGGKKMRRNTAKAEGDRINEAGLDGPSRKTRPPKRCAVALQGSGAGGERGAPKRVKRGTASGDPTAGERGPARKPRPQHRPQGADQNEAVRKCRVSSPVQKASLPVAMGRRKKVKLHVQIAKTTLQRKRKLDRCKSDLRLSEAAKVVTVPERPLSPAELRLQALRRRVAEKEASAKVVSSRG